jgi:hypothetical protein
MQALQDGLMLISALLDGYKKAGKIYIPGCHTTGFPEWDKLAKAYGGIPKRIAEELEELAAEKD